MLIVESPRLLYITPIIPAPTGRGLAMRAYHNLIALASLYDISLLVVPNSSTGNEFDRQVVNLCEEIYHVPLGHRDLHILFRLFCHKTLRRLFPDLLRQPVDFKYITRRRKRVAVKVLSKTTWHVIHCFRLYTLPYALEVKKICPPAAITLDLDEVESIARRNISELCRSSGETRLGIALATEAKLYRKVEGRLLPGIDSCYVCSEVERRLLCTEGLGKEAVVVPNVMPSCLPEMPKTQSQPTTFVILGSYAYYPNLEGALFFCREVLPLLRQDIPGDFTVQIIGGGMPRHLAMELSSLPEVQVTGEVADVSPYYAKATAALVPIRAGGGTRLKILEAFAHNVPVISTTKGVEGIDGSHEVHLLIADEAAGFAAQCKRIVVEQGLAGRLSRNAAVLMAQTYSMSRLKEAFSRFSGSPRQGGLRVKERAGEEKAVERDIADLGT